MRLSRSLAQKPAPWRLRARRRIHGLARLALGLIGLGLDAGPARGDGAPSPEEPARYVELGYAPLAERPARARALCDAALCVHFAGAGDDAAAAALLASARDSLDALLALKLPRPVSDAGLGGDGRVDLYLDEAAPGPAAFIDPGSASAGWDRASAFVVTPPLGGGCVRPRELAGALGHALLAGQDGALEPNAAAMLSGYLATLARPCALAEAQELDVAQRAPERSFPGRRGAPGRGSFLFPWFLEDSFGSGELGKLTVSLAAISSQRTKAGPLLDEPDLFDSLRITQLRNQTSLGQTLLDFAVARAFLGSRSDGLHLADVEQYGELARPRIEWSVTHKSLPRRLAPLRPIEALGATYLFVDLAGITPDAEITFVADWEEPVAFRWALIKLDKDGAELGRTDAVPVLGETHIEKTVRQLGDAGSLLIVGLNEGEGRRDEPFDPGRLREEGHAYLVTLYP